MSDLLSLLKTAKDSVRNLDPDQGLQAIQEFERQLQSTLPLREEVALLQAEIESLRDLAAASCEGIGDARKALEQIIRESETLKVYNSKGQLESNPAGHPDGRSF